MVNNEYIEVSNRPFDLKKKEKWFPNSIFSFIFSFQIQLETTTSSASPQKILLQASRMGPIKSKPLLMMVRMISSTRHPSSSEKVYAKYQNMFQLNQVPSLGSSGGTLLAMSNFKTEATMTCSWRMLVGEFQRIIATWIKMQMQCPSTPSTIKTSL